MERTNHGLTPSRRNANTTTTMAAAYLRHAPDGVERHHVPGDEIVPLVVHNRHQPHGIFRHRGDDARRRLVAVDVGHHERVPEVAEGVREHASGVARDVADTLLVAHAVHPQLLAQGGVDHHHNLERGQYGLRHLARGGLYLGNDRVVQGLASGYTRVSYLKDPA